MPWRCSSMSMFEEVPPLDDDVVVDDDGTEELEFDGEDKQTEDS